MRRRGCFGPGRRNLFRRRRQLPLAILVQPSPSIYTWIDGYALTNFRAGFRADNGLNVYAWVRNAFDTNYFEQLNFGPGNTGLIAGSLGDPRTFGATLSKRF